MQTTIIGAEIRPSVSFMDDFLGRGRLKESGLMTKKVEMKKRTRVATEYPSILDMMDETGGTGTRCYVI